MMTTQNKTKTNKMKRGIEKRESKCESKRKVEKVNGTTKDKNNGK